MKQNNIDKTCCPSTLGSIRDLPTLVCVYIYIYIYIYIYYGFQIVLYSGFKFEKIDKGWILADLKDI